MSVGEAIARAREERGLSVDDVAERTRIRATLIRGIEADDFSALGGTVYARGHIRSIARVVGIDPAPLLADFERETSTEAPQTGVMPVTTDPHETARAERRRPNWAAAMAVALVVIIVALTVDLVGHRKPSTGTTAQLQPTTGPTASAPARHQKTPGSPPPSSVANLPSDKATMLVRMQHGQTWLSVSSTSGASLFQGLLRAGERKLFSDKHGLTFVIGNAPAVDLVVNGHDIGAPRSSGNVSRGRVTPGSDTVQLA